MSGTDARLGFRFQDWFLLREVLIYLRRVLANSWRQGSIEPREDISRCPVRFGVEAATTPAEAEPTWDSLVIEDPRKRVIEVKSGEVDAKDRRTFWQRIRKEVARERIDETSPVLVVDPSKIGNCESFRELTKVAIAHSGSPLPAEAPARVADSSSLLDEALWWMCVAPEDQVAACPPLSATDALEILRRFELVELEAYQLESEVSAHLEVLFPQLLVETSARLLRGWLDERATAPNLNDRKFSLVELLRVVEGFDQCAALKPSQLAKWRTLWKELRQQQLARSSGRLGQTGAALQPNESQPDILKQINQGSSSRILFLGEGGAGKTTLLNQLANNHPESRTLLVWANGVSEPELELLAESLRFQSALCSLGSGEEAVNVMVDALEEADAPKREAWARLLSRSVGLPHVYAVATMREADFRGDGKVRAQLPDWREVTLRMWPEQIVRNLLVSVGHSQFSPAVLQLLRRPILLDLYWRTFVESPAATPPVPGEAMTRHGLLRAFWLNRLLHSVRHQHLGDVAGRCATVFAAAANTLGVFPEAGLDLAAVAALLSEGVLVKESGLQTRVQFRHPFLRDFAFAQWCLAGENGREVHRRWIHIRSSIARTGALRALLEALADDWTERDFPDLPLADLVLVFLEQDIEFQTDLARALGALAPNQRSNPALWPVGIQRQLSDSFGSQLLAEARHHANTTWVEVLETWPLSASWLSDDFPVEVWRYVSFVAARLQQEPESSELRRHAIAGVQALRRMSDETRFREVFANQARWLKGVVIRLVAPLMPDAETLGWLEREAQYAAQRTREAILEVLIFIAPVDFERTAKLYRTAIGLSEREGVWTIDPAVWHGLMAEHAFGWCLGSHGQKPGLLERYPLEFLPVALQAAEALSTEYLANKRKSMRRFAADIAKAMGGAVEEPKEAVDLPPPAIIDDRPEYTFWKLAHRAGPYERCLSLIYDCVRQISAATPNLFVMRAGPDLAASRLATVQSFLFDVCLAHFEEPGFDSVLREALLDNRIYLVSGLAFWVQEGLARGWPGMSGDQRRVVIEHLDSLKSGGDPGAPFRRLQYLAALPQDDLSPELRSEVETHRASDNTPFRRPETFGGGSFRSHTDHSDDADRLLGECPPGSRDLFKRFYREYHDYLKTESDEKERVRLLPLLLRTADEVASLFSCPENTLKAHGLVWV